MKYGVTWVPDDLKAYPTWVRASEEKGFSFIGVPDTQASLYRDCYVTLTSLFLNTQRVCAGPLVTNPITRHPAVTASAISSADEISGGRAILALSTGDSAVYNLGLKPSSHKDMEEYVQTLRSLFTGEDTLYRGATIRLKWARRQIPIYLAADGPRTLRLAGRIADGVIVGMGVLPEVVQSALEHIAAGASESGRRLEELDVWFMARVNIANDRPAAVRQLRPSLAAAANHTFRFTLTGKAVPPELEAGIRNLMANYNVQFHSAAGDNNPNARLLDETGLTDYMSERLAIVGDEDYCVQRIRSLREAGVRGLIVRPLVQDKTAFLERWGRVMQWSRISG